MISEVSRMDESPINIPPFLVNVLSSMASNLGGRADLKKSTVYTDCGRITLGMGEEGTIWVHGLYIDDDSQLEGCGSKKLKALEESVSKLSTTTMKIKLRPVRSAIGFYLKNGYGLYLETSSSEKYYLARDKAYGTGFEKYVAKTRMSIYDKIEDGLWTHEVLRPIYEKSDLFDENEPTFYSLWISDIARGDYIHAEKTVHPSRGNMLSKGV